MKCKFCTLRTVKTLLKIIIEDLSKYTFHAYEIEDNIFKMVMLSKLIYRVNAILIKKNFFKEIVKFILTKILRQCRGPEHQKQF